MEELFLGQRYRATERIGTGGMADVYKAVDEVLGRTVAVKVMHAHLADDPSFAARFRHEAQAAANLMSPNIVNMYDWGQDDGTFYIVMEYVRGTDLKSMIEEQGALPSRTVAEIGAQVCAALAVAHGYDIIHRDIKPHNIMVQADGAAKLMDFGIARAGPSMKTQTGSVLGTAHYVSPEAALGKPLTAASDLYSVGVALYEAATGRVPFEADTPVAVAVKQVNEEAVSPRLVNPDIDAALDAVIVKAMQKQTADRYVSANDLQRDLNVIAQGSPVDVAAGYAGVAAAAASVGTLPNVALTSVMPQVSGMEPVSPAATSEVTEATDPAPPVVTPPRRTLWPWIVAGAVLLVAALGAMWGIGLRSGQGGLVPDVPTPTEASSTADPVVIEKAETVDVPKITDMREDAAVKSLERAGFIPKALPSQFSSDVRKGVVFKQTPSHASAAPRGSVVTYVVSLGTDPDANGKGKRGGGSKDDD